VEPWVPIITSVVTILASSGLWAWITSRMQRKDVKRTQTDKLVQGIAYDKIVSLGLMYIERGWITKDEYEDYRKYLYDPYKALGGNGVTERVMAEVSNLPLKSRAKYAQILEEAKSRRSDDQSTRSDYPDVLVE
jgi:hypothetical protein